MQNHTNHLGQPVGPPLPKWAPPPVPSREPIVGRFCRLVPVDPQHHAAALYAANALDTDNRMWTYLPYGPFATLTDYRSWMEGACMGNDPLFFTIMDGAGNKPLGLAAYLRIDPRSGSIEVGHLAYSPLLQRTAAATEAMYLMMARAFDLSYRRYEWKCDALNAPSRSAAERLGFTFEGIFRQATVVKGRNRDTAWFAIVDFDWPAIREAFIRWLSPDNFDVDGRQRTLLAARRANAPR
jgi:RimJ/RimL family protein N-acetyltransferase